MCGLRLGYVVLSFHCSILLRSFVTRALMYNVILIIEFLQTKLLSIIDSNDFNV